MGKAEKQTTEQSALAAGAAGIRELRAVLARIAGERERIARLAGNAEKHSEKIAQLKRERAEVMATAMIDGGEGDIAALDERIAEAEQAAAKALSEGTVAADALRVLDERRAAIEAELKQGTQAQLELVLRDLRARHEQALAAYNIAVDALRWPLETMRSVETALDTVHRRQAQLAGNPRWAGGPGLSFYIAKELRDGGLRVVRADRQIWPCSWLIGPQDIGGSREFCRDYLTAAALD